MGWKSARDHDLVIAIAALLVRSNMNGTASGMDCPDAVGLKSWDHRGFTKYRTEHLELVEVHPANDIRDRFSLPIALVVEPKKMLSRMQQTPWITGRERS